MRNGKYCAGVIGMRMGNYHCAAYEENADCILDAICDIHEDYLQEKQKEHNVRLVTTDYRDIVNDPEIDIISVASPDYFHAEHCIAALKAGKHVICEKPLTLSLEEAKAIIEESKRSKGKFMIGQVCRYAPGFVQAKRLIDQGLIGDLGPKFDIFLRYVEREWDYADDGLDLKGKIAHHFGGTSTSVTEGDLVNSSDLLTDRIFVMTAHKAKGLEFDNVVILGTNNGRYPSFRVNNVLRSQRSTPEQVSEATAQRNEDARRLYVALTRAKKRICVSYPLHDAQGYDTQLSPFMAPIRPFFQ